MPFGVLLALAATTGAGYTVVDEAGRAVSGATVDFVDAAGAHDIETTDDGGRGTARADFSPVTLSVRKAGYSELRVRPARSGERLVLVRVLPVIGSVSVATGTLKSQHELPLAAALLDRTAVDLAPAASTDRLLRALPGFDRTRSNSAFTNYGQLRASFSGAGNDRGAVLVDGLPAQDGFGGQIDWQAYPTDSIARIELLRGAGSALYGSGAIGGVLDITTFGPRTGAVPADGRVTFGAGSSSDLDNGIALRTPLGGKAGLSLSSVANRFAYRDLPPAYATPLDHAAVSSSGASDLKVRFDDGATTVDAATLFSSDHQDEGRPNYTFDRTLRQEAVNATHRIGPALARFGAYLRDTTVYNLADIFPQSPGKQRYHQHVPTDENGFFAALSAQPGVTELSMIVEERRVTGRSEQFGPTDALQALGTGVQLGQGIGLQATFHAKRVELLVGARADRIRYDDLALRTVTAATPAPLVTDVAVPGHAEGAISPRAALRYDASPRVALRLSSGGGFRAPYLNELVRGFNVGKVVMAPNPNLIPERSLTSGAGVDVLLGTNGRFTFDFVETRVTNAIAFQTVGPTLMRRANIDRTQSDSQTLTYAQQVGTCTRLRLSGTTQNSRITNGPAESVGKQLAFVPNRAASLGIDAAGRGPLAFSVDGSYVGQTYADDLQQSPLGAALLFGATVRATTASGTSFSLVADNLTHQTYLSSIDRYGPPLTVGLRIGIPLGPRATPAPGACAI